DCLRSARHRIRHNLANPALSKDDIAILAGIVAQCDLVELGWRQVERCCDGIPQTFVHADLVESNLRVRTGETQMALVALDWESAGWAVPAVDLALSGLHLSTYWNTVRKAWPGLDMQALQGLTVVGRIFQLLELISCESTGLEAEWLYRPMKRMRYYRAETSEAIQAVKDRP